jgi:hypothetical protein
MAAGVIHRRVLVAGRGEMHVALCSSAGQAGWHCLEADSFPHARFLLAGEPCDVVLVDDSLAGPDWNEGLAWVAAGVPAPLVLVAHLVEDVVLAALRHGVLWLPPEMVQRCPNLLGALLDQADALGRERQEAARHQAALADSEARVERLLDMLWEAAPAEGPSRWFGQRHVLERLEEEVERSHRYGAPLSVVLGELAAPPGQELDREQARHLGSWLAGQVGPVKRRCDVAGHYGPHGFLMVLPHTTPGQALGACQRLRAVLARPPHTDAPAVHACFGLASLPGDPGDLPGLLRRAEERLDRARSSPEGGVVAE